MPERNLLEHRQRIERQVADRQRAIDLVDHELADCADTDPADTRSSRT